MSKSYSTAQNATETLIILGHPLSRTLQSSWFPEALVLMALRAAQRHRWVQLKSTWVLNEGNRFPRGRASTGEIMVHLQVIKLAKVLFNTDQEWYLFRFTSLRVRQKRQERPSFLKNVFTASLKSFVIDRQRFQHILKGATAIEVH